MENNAWTVNKALILGRDHELSKRNRQDYCRYTSGKRVAGVVCDGCGEGEFSETGAALLGNFIINELNRADLNAVDAFKDEIKSASCRFLNRLLDILNFSSENLKTEFIRNFLLTTFVFCVIEGERAVIGSSGDGIIITDESVNIIDQDNRPNYLAYRVVPSGYMDFDDYNFDDLKVEFLDANALRRIAIASDGLKPVVSAGRIDEIFGKTRRQLQRRLNVIQIKEKIFYDDVSIVVFERTGEYRE
ncbi:MAG: protein phosphatase 2C domain-containing protein [Spirochaetales bacterium]|nr:protein phosphatase 2C domain-containing protein [Spirochaetales bacterium]